MVSFSRPNSGSFLVHLLLTIFPEYLLTLYRLNRPLETIKQFDKHQLSNIRFELEKLKVGKSIAIGIDVYCACKYLTSLRLT